MPSVEIKRWGYATGFDVEQGPPDPENFCLTLWVDTVEEGRQGVTTYQIEICTPLGLVEHFDEISQFAAKIGVSPEGCVFGRGLLLVRRYDLDLIERALKGVGENLKYYAFDAS